MPVTATEGFIPSSVVAQFQISCLVTFLSWKVHFCVHALRVALKQLTPLWQRLPSTFLSLTALQMQRAPQICSQCMLQKALAAHCIVSPLLYQAANIAQNNVCQLFKPPIELFIGILAAAQVVLQLSTRSCFISQIKAILQEYQGRFCCRYLGWFSFHVHSKFGLECLWCS